MKAMVRAARAREKAYVAYMKARTRYAVFHWERDNMYRRDSAVTKLFKRESTAVKACVTLNAGLAPQDYVVRTVTLSDAEAGTSPLGQCGIL